MKSKKPSKSFSLNESWQPIETAPKDECIDVWVRRFEVGQAGKVKTTEVGRVTDVRWDKTYRILRTGGNYEHIYGEKKQWVVRRDLDWEDVEQDDDRITHWRPLPRPPETPLASP